MALSFCSLLLEYYCLYSIMLILSRVKKNNTENINKTIIKLYDNIYLAKG